MWWRGYGRDVDGGWEGARGQAGVEGGAEAVGGGSGERGEGRGAFLGEDFRCSAGSFGRGLESRHVGLMREDICVRLANW